MQFAEDFLPLLMINCQPLDGWSINFVVSLNDQAIGRGKALTTQQARVLMRIIREQRDNLIAKDLVDKWQIDQFLAHPAYRRPVILSTKFPREARYMGGNIIAFRFKLDEMVRAAIKAIATAPDATFIIEGMGGSIYGSRGPWFDGETRLWLVPVTRATLPAIMNIIHRYDFGFDKATLDYLELCENSKGTKSTAMMSADGGRIFINICDDDPLLAWAMHVAPDGRPE